MALVWFVVFVFVLLLSWRCNAAVFVCVFLFVLVVFLCLRFFFFCVFSVVGLLWVLNMRCVWCCVVCATGRV